MLDPFAVIPVVKPRRVPRKCSTCANRECRVRGTVVNWLHCSKWLPEGVTKNDKAAD